MKTTDGQTLKCATKTVTYRYPLCPNCSDELCCEEKCGSTIYMLCTNKDCSVCNDGEGIQLDRDELDWHDLSNW